MVGNLIKDVFLNISIFYSKKTKRLPITGQSLFLTFLD